MIDHVTANVSDFEQAKRFYEQALAPLGYSVQMEFEGAAGFGRASRTSGSARAPTVARRTSRSPRTTARASTSSTRRRSPPEDGTTGLRAYARITTRRTTRHSFTTRTETTSRR
jgi:catechol 2,3-dioxygenase-like lactoylglutathione lyase family enzyme